MLIRCHRTTKMAHSLSCQCSLLKCYPAASSGFYSLKALNLALTSQTHSPCGRVIQVSLWVLYKQWKQTLVTLHCTWHDWTHIATNLIWYWKCLNRFYEEYFFYHSLCHYKHARDKIWCLQFWHEPTSRVQGQSGGRGIHLEARSLKFKLKTW